MGRAAGVSNLAVRIVNDCRDKPASISRPSVSSAISAGQSSVAWIFLGSICKRVEQHDRWLARSARLSSRDRHELIKGTSCEVELWGV